MRGYLHTILDIPSLSGLESLSSIGTHLEISNNPNLTSLDGLRNLVHVGGRLIIKGNDALGVDQIEEFVSRLKARGFKGELSTELLAP